MLECRRVKFALLDTHDIDPCGTRTDHEVHFFVMRRRSGQMLRQCIRRDKHLDWRCVPRPVSGREMYAVRRTLLTPSSEPDQIQIAVGNSLAASVSEREVGMIRTIFGLIDGRRTLREISDGMRAGGLPLMDSDFRELFSYLTVRGSHDV